MCNIATTEWLYDCVRVGAQRMRGLYVGRAKLKQVSGRQVIVRGKQMKCVRDEQG